ncbi:MAG: hypothetical protein U0166_20985 [Acidobacteriota bacterium]
MSKSNGTHVAVEFEDWSEKPQPSRRDLESEVERLRVVADRLRVDCADARQNLARLHQSEVAERRRADVSEQECLRLLRQLDRIPSRIRSFFDRIHRIRRAWDYVTRTSQA